MGKTVLEAKVVDIQKRRYPSKHYVYVIEVTWSEGTQTLIYRRYSKFFEFQCGLLAKFPIQAGEKNPADRCIPFLPGKKILGRSHVRSVAEKRMGPISDYCRAVIRLPAELSQDPYILNFFEVTPEDINPPVKEEKVKKVETANEISDPILLEQYTAIADYKKQKNTECSLSAGQVVEVIDKNDNGWWFVHMDDLNEGWVPATYLEPIYGQNEVMKPITLDKTETHITTSNYTAKNPDELTFERGVLMEVYEKGMDGWWKARYLDSDGFVPACYLTRYYGTISTSGPSGPTEMVTSVQEAIQSTLKPGASLSGASRVSPAKSVKAWPLKTSGIDPYAEEPIYAPTPRKESIQKSTNRRPPPVIPTTSSKPTPFKKRQPSFSEDEGAEYTSIDDFTKEESDEEDAFHDYETMSEHYTTIGDFNAGVDDGLSFTAGKDVAVITKNPSGWWFVEMDSKEGWVPSSYLEKSFRPSGAASPKPVVPPTNKRPLNKSTSPPTLPSVKPSKTNGRQSTSPPIPKVSYPSTSSSTSVSTSSSSSKPAAPVKPKPAVANKRSVPIVKTDETGGTTSVAAMASILSKGLNNTSTTETSNRSNTVSKPIVPKRVPTKSSDDSKLTASRDSVKRSSSSDAIRDITSTSKSKSPPPLKPRPNDTIPPPQKRLVQSTENTPKMGMKFLRKSTENLLDIDSPPLPQPIPRASTISNKSDPKPRPPSRSPAVNAFSSHTMRLNELEQSLKSNKPVAAKRSTGAPPVLKKLSSGSGPPKRPQTGPSVKKAPPPRPSNSPAQTRKPSTSSAPRPFSSSPQRPTKGPSPITTKKKEEPIYVTIADFIGTESSSISFKEGEAVEVLEKSDEGWWFVNIRGNEGWVPSTFIDKTTDKPDRPKPPQPAKRKPSRPFPPPAKVSSDTYIATGDYDTPVYEDSGISLVCGQYYEVIERTDTGWWYVQYGSQEGWAPSSFLEPATVN